MNSIKPRWMILLALFVMSFFVSGQEFVWGKAHSLPVPLQEIYPAVVGNSIYIAGAFQKTTKERATLSHLAASKKMHIFDTRLNAWKDGPSLPQARHHLGLVAKSNTIFAIGGFDAKPENPWIIKNSVFQLDLISKTWSNGPNLPVPQAESVYAILNNEVHVVGGRINENGKLVDTGLHWRLVNGESWRPAASLKVSRNSAASCVWNNMLYVFGGRINTKNMQNTALVSRYDPKTDNWIDLAQMPQATAGAACAVLNDKLYVLGGEEYDYFVDENGHSKLSTQTFNQIWSYDPKTNIWITLPISMTSTRHGFGAVSIHNQVYVIGGAVGAGAVGTTDIVETFRVKG